MRASSSIVSSTAFVGGVVAALVAAGLSLAGCADRGYGGGPATASGGSQGGTVVAPGPDDDPGEPGSVPAEEPPRWETGSSSPTPPAEEPDPPVPPSPPPPPLPAGGLDFPLALLAATINGLVSVVPGGPAAVVSSERTWGGVGGRAIELGTDGSVFGVTDGGIDRFDPATRSWSRFVDLPYQTEGLRMSPGGELHATTSQGLYRIDASGQATLLSEQITWGGVGSGALDLDAQGNVYVVLSEVVNRYDVQAGTWSVFAELGFQTEGLRYDRASGDFFAATLGGLMRIDANGNATVLTDAYGWGGVGSGGIDLGADGWIYVAETPLVQRYHPGTDTWETVADLGGQIEGLRFWSASR